MKELLLSFAFIVIAITSALSQVFDSIGIISPDHNIEDLAFKGDLLFAATGEGGVWQSTDEGFTWTQTSSLPDAGFGQEAANSIYVGSNGDIIVGGNLNYNGAALSGVVFRSSNNGASWSFESFEGLGGYEKCKKIVELSNGDLMMHGGQAKLFTSSLSGSVWTQITAPGGVIFGFEQIEDNIFVVTNPSTGTAGTWVSSNLGESWELYGGNGTAVSQGTVTITPVLQSSMYKFIGIGGTYGSHGVFRSGINDTLWVEINNGLNSTGVYPICMATDNSTIWMVFQDSGGGCKFTSTSDYGNNWETPIAGLPQQGVGGPCVPKMMVFKTHLYTFANQSIYRIEDVATPSSTGKQKYYSDNIEVFPNPATTNINIQFKKLVNNGNWEIVNLYGQVLKSGYINTNSNNFISIDIENLPTGYFLINTFTGGNNSMTKFFKK